MNLKEKMGYVRGIADGIKLDSATDEGRLLKAMVDLMGDLTNALHEMAEAVSYLEDEFDDFMEDIFDEADEEDGGSRFDNVRYLHSSLFGEDGDEDDDDDEDDGALDPSCPHCGIGVPVDADALLNGSVICPGCGQKLVLEIQEDCGGECCGHDHGGTCHDGHKHKHGPDCKHD